MSRRVNQKNAKDDKDEKNQNMESTQKNILEVEDILYSVCSYLSNRGLANLFRVNRTIYDSSKTITIGLFKELSVSCSPAEYKQITEGKDQVNNFPQLLRELEGIHQNEKKIAEKNMEVEAERSRIRREEAENWISMMRNPRAAARFGGRPGRFPHNIGKRLCYFMTFLLAAGVLAGEVGVILGDRRRSDSEGMTTGNYVVLVIFSLIALCLLVPCIKEHMKKEPIDQLIEQRERLLQERDELKITQGLVSESSDPVLDTKEFDGSPGSAV